MLATLQTTVRRVALPSQRMQALLDDRLSTIRLPINPQPVENPYSSRLDKKDHPGGLWRLAKELPENGAAWRSDGNLMAIMRKISPYKPGTLLWLQEPWRAWDYEIDGTVAIEYKDGQDYLTIPPEGKRPRDLHSDKVNGVKRWRPAVVMPRWASRVTLKVTNLEIDRAQWISPREAVKEGCPDKQGVMGDISSSARKLTPKGRIHWYYELWETLYGKKYPLHTNPWVWVLTVDPIWENVDTVLSD